MSDLKNELEKIPERLRWLIVCTPLPLFPFTLAATLGLKNRDKMNKPLKKVPFQELRDAVWNPDVPVSYPHGMDHLLIKVHDATLKELVNWSLNWLMYSEFKAKTEVK